LAKSISDAGWNILFQFLRYKAENAGRTVVAVPPAFTSQICSCCGELVPKKLSERWHNCPHCGLSIQRDVNAAINILAVATKKQGPGRGLRGYEQVAACR
jgi:putative transposase